MSTQWHPLFAHLLGLLLQQFYEVQTEVPVSDLPRRGDLLIIRRHRVEAPPFRGLWGNLNDWNVAEFKGPGDDAQEQDLELLVHVGTGLTYRLNEERLARKLPALSNHQVSFWYLVPSLGQTFLGHARTRAALDYQTGGVWRGSVWGHPVWLVSYSDLPVEEDTLPLHLLAQEAAAPRALGELIVQRQELWQRFGTWLYALQPQLWKEIRSMAKTTGIIDWDAIDKAGILDELLRVIPPERVIQTVGIERALESIGLERVIEAVGLARVLEAVGLARVIKAVGPARVIEAVGLAQILEATGEEKVLDELLARVPAERIQELLRRRQQQE